MVSEQEYKYDEQLIFTPDWSGSVNHPNFIATGGMYDAPMYYNTRFLDDDNEINKSYFVRLKSTENTNYLNGTGITFNTQYTYFDMDLFNEGYSEMGINTLDEYPSFNMYSVVKTSPEFEGYFEKTENFYLYDYINGSQSNDEISTAIEHNVRSMSFQNRTSTGKGGDEFSTSTFTEYFSEYLVPRRSYRQISAGEYVGLHSNLAGAFNTQLAQEVTTLNPDFLVPEEIVDAMGRNHYF